MNALETKLTNELLPEPGMRKIFTVRQSNNSGGKAGTGNNRTTSFSLFSEKLLKGSGYFSWVIGDPVSWDRAVYRAHEWVENTLIKNGYCPHCAEDGCTSDHK